MNCAAKFSSRATVGHVTRHLGTMMVVDITDRTITEYQTARLKEGAAPKTINEEVGFLLRLLGEAGDFIRARLRRQKKLKLAVGREVGKAYSPEEKEALLAARNEPAACDRLIPRTGSLRPQLTPPDTRGASVPSASAPGVRYSKREK